MSTDKEGSEKRLFCSVSTCRTTYGSLGEDGQPVTSHCFPRNPKLASIWMSRTGKTNKTVSKHGRICSHHFLPTDYKRDLQNELLGIPLRRKLNPDAVPSLLLPNNSPSIEQEVQRTARLKEKCERRTRHEYIKQVEEELKESKESEETAIPTIDDVTPSKRPTPNKRKFVIPTPPPDPQAIRIMTQKQKIKETFRIHVLKFINSPSFTNRTDFPTRAQYDHMLRILQQGRAYKNDPYENKILAEFNRIPQGGDGTMTASTEDFILARHDTPGKRILIADDFVDEVWKSHNARGHVGCFTTLKTLKDKYVYVPTRLVLDYIKECPTCATDTEIEDVNAPIVIDLDFEGNDVDDSSEAPVSSFETQNSSIPTDDVHFGHGNDMAVVTSEDAEPPSGQQCFICGRSSAASIKWEGTGKHICELLEFPFSKSMSLILDNWTSCVPCSEHIKEGVIIMKQLESLRKQLRQHRKLLKKIVRVSRQYSKTPLPGSTSLSVKFKTLYSVLSYSVPPNRKSSLSADGQEQGTRRKQHVQVESEGLEEDEGGWDSIILDEEEMPPEVFMKNNSTSTAVIGTEGDRMEFGSSDHSEQTNQPLPEEEAIEVSESPADEEIVVWSPPGERKRRKWTPRHLHLLKCTFDVGCHRRFLNQSTMDAHILVKHQGMKPYSCEECGRGFQSMKILRNHVNVRHTAKEGNVASMKSCGVCEKSFQENESEEMRTHEDLHKNNNGSQFSCVIGNCQESFRNIVFLKRHVRCHHEDRPHLCTLCGASFANNVGLRRHKLVHSEERPHQCEVCGKSYRSIGHLGVHRKYHFLPKEPNLLCSGCGKLFRMQKYLKRHQRESCSKPPGKRGKGKKRKLDPVEIEKSIEATIQHEWEEGVV